MARSSHRGMFELGPPRELEEDEEAEVAAAAAAMSSSKVDKAAGDALAAGTIMIHPPTRSSSPKYTRSIASVLGPSSFLDGSTTPVSIPGSAQLSRRQSRLNSRPSFSGTPLLHSKFTEVMDGLKELSLDSPASNAHSKLAKTATGVRNLANQLGQAEVHLDVRAVLIVTKARDNSLVEITRDMASHVIDEYGVHVYVDAQLRKSKRFDSEPLESTGLLRYWTPDMLSQEGAADEIDLVIALGGDGTTLLVGHLFQRTVPPVISFSLGSLGFLTNYSIDQYKQHLEQVFEGGVRVNLRMRFECARYNSRGDLQSAPQQVVNDIVIDRGPNPWLAMLELYGNDDLLTVVQADGLILSTPTGSTAYSLSAGGSLVHPEIPAMCVTPICPHTLSFRPMLLPDSMRLRVSVPHQSRSTAWISLDGRTRMELARGDYITVQASQYPFPTLVSRRTEFIDSVSRSFHWNNTKQQKPFSESSSVSSELYDIDF